MATFRDGPAKGQILMLKRTPIFLRVTEENGKFDALNELSDTPRPAEKLYAYLVVKNNGNVHYRCSGGRGGFYPSVEYGFIEQQPADEVMRIDTTWEKWCRKFYEEHHTHINDPDKP